MAYPVCAPLKTANRSNLPTYPNFYRPAIFGSIPKTRMASPSGGFFLDPSFFMKPDPKQLIAKVEADLERERMRFALLTKQHLAKVKAEKADGSTARAIWSRVVAMTFQPISQMLGRAVATVPTSSR